MHFFTVYKLIKLTVALSHNYGIKITAMAESRFSMMKQIKDFEWSSLLDLTGKGLHQFNAVGKDMNCSQLMRNSGLDFTVELKPVQFTDDNGTVNESDRLHS